MHVYKTLVPSVVDMLELLDEAISTARQRKPIFLAIDVENAVDAMRRVLEGTNISVQYYPPPSQEELAYSNRTNPYLTPSEKNRNLRPCCAICESEFSAKDGLSPLLKCAKCKREYYCCKEHQKQHWKIHKMMCISHEEILAQNT